MSEVEVLPIEFTEDELAEFSSVEKRVVREPADAGWNEVVISDVQATVSAKGKGGYQLVVKLVPLAEPGDESTACDAKSLTVYLPLAIPNPRTGWEPTKNGKKFSQKRLRHFLSSAGLITDEYPQFTPESGWWYEGENIDDDTSVELRNKANAAVLQKAVSLYNDANARDELINTTLWVNVEHKEENYLDKTILKAEVKSFRNECPMD